MKLGSAVGAAKCCIGEEFGQCIHEGGKGVELLLCRNVLDSKSVEEDTEAPVVHWGKERQQRFHAFATDRGINVWKIVPNEEFVIRELEVMKSSAMELVMTLAGIGSRR